MSEMYVKHRKLLVNKIGKRLNFKRFVYTTENEYIDGATEFVFKIGK